MVAWHARCEVLERENCGRGPEHRTRRFKV
jgi:hypothetical protein